MSTWPPMSAGRALAALRKAAAANDLDGVARSAFVAARAGATSNAIRRSMPTGEPGGAASGLLVGLGELAQVLDAGYFVVEASGAVSAKNPPARDVLGRGIGVKGLAALLGLALEARADRLDLRELVRASESRSRVNARVDDRLVWLLREGPDVHVLVEGVERSSAPPEDSALRHELSNTVTAVSALAASAESGSHEAMRNALHRIREVTDASAIGPRTQHDQLSNEKRVLRRVDIELVELVDTLAPFAAESGVNLDAAVKPGLRAAAHGATLRLVVWNLLKNAIEASSRGGSVTLEAEDFPGEIALRVRDAGSGIPPELQAKVFDAHFSTKSGGRGLGLSLVRNELERVGGEVTIETSGATGTVLLVRLPSGAREPTLGDEHDSGVLTSRPLQGFEVALLSELSMLERALVALGAGVSRYVSAENVPSDLELLVVDGAILDLVAVGEFARHRRARRVAYLARTNESITPGIVDWVLPRSFDVNELVRALQSLTEPSSDAG